MDRRSLLAALASLPAWTTPVFANDDKNKKNKEWKTSKNGSTAITVPTVRIKARVIVIGGGMGGATVAKYLRLWSNGTIGVTLIDRNPTYPSCIMSSLVLTGQRTMASQYYGYDELRRRYGVQTFVGEVVAVDPVTVQVRLSDGTVLSADRIVMAPGIDFDEVPGLGNSDNMPHAWKAGPQTTLLARQLAAMPAGGTVVLTIPPAPYRCPPGPYERACLLADWLKVNKPGSKLIVLDANPDFVTEKDNFSNAFFHLHGSVIEYHPNVAVTEVDPTSMTLQTTAGTLRNMSVVNLIPRQRAGGLVAATGLNNATEGRFAGVDVLSYQSTVSGAHRVHVIGDACATTQPKAGHIANQEGKVCADAIIRLVDGGAPDSAPVTNSACYSTITMTQASWLTAVFQYDPATRSMVAVPQASGASVGWSSGHFKQMNKWFDALMADTFA